MLLKFYGPVMCQNRPDVGNIIPITRLRPGCRCCKPEVISWWKVNITVFCTRFLSPTDQKCVESSAFWQFFYYFPTSKFRYTAGESVKMWCQEFDIYQYIYEYIDITPSISNMDFYISSTWDYITFDFFSHVKKKCFSKVSRSVISWRSG